MPFLKNLPELNTKPIREIIYEHLRKAIIRGDLKADTTFTDGEIAEEYGISRTPVREAVQKLEAEGFIERVPMKGNRVCSISPVELAHAFSIRKALETLAMRYAALRITDEELEEMKTLLSEGDALFSEKSGDELVEGFFPIAKKFNQIAFEACGSVRLTELVWNQRDLFDRYRVVRLVLPNRIHKSFARRKALYEAFKEHDQEKAGAIWAEHLEESFSIWREKSGYAKELEGFQFL